MIKITKNGFSIKESYDYLINNYSLKSRKDIATYLGVSINTLKVWIKKLKLTKIKKLDDYIHENYDLISLQELAIKCNLSYKQVHKRCTRLGLRKTDNQQRKYSCNDNIFDDINSNTAYILGFLITDGHLTKNTNQITWTVSIKDKDILVKIRDIICPTRKIREFYSKRTIDSKQHGYVTLSFSSRKIYKYLELIGFTNNKTGLEPLIIKFIPEEFHYDYLRGIIDGDGWIGFRNSKRNFKPYMGIISLNKDFLEEIRSLICDNFGKIGLRIRNNRAEFKTETGKFRKNIYTYDIRNGYEIIKILDKVYENIDNKLYLDRKYQKYLTIKENCYYDDNRRTIKNRMQLYDR